MASHGAHLAIAGASRDVVGASVRNASRASATGHLIGACVLDVVRAYVIWKIENTKDT
jgi:hypothetical protein